MAQPKPQQNEKQIQQNKQEREATSLDSGFPGGSMVKIPPANAGDTGDVGSMPESGNRKWQLTPVFLPAKF